MISTREAPPRTTSRRLCSTVEKRHVLICPSDLLPERVVYNQAALNPTWSWGFYGMSSYGGNAGRRSVSIAKLTRDGVFYVGSDDIRVGGIADGTSSTLLFGERFHSDAGFDAQSQDLWPGTSPMAKFPDSRIAAARRLPSRLAP